MSILQSKEEVKNARLLDQVLANHFRHFATFLLRTLNTPEQAKVVTVTGRARWRSIGGMKRGKEVVKKV